MAIRVRPIGEADLPALAGIDAAYAAEHGLEGTVSSGTLRFFGRTEHSFTAETAAPGGASRPAPVGFLLAQALWTGDRPLVLVSRVATAGGHAGAAEALVKALVKSAYDAGVYDLLARAPATDALLQEVLATDSFVADTQLPFVRVLGSRGQAGAGGPAGGAHAAGGGRP